MNKLKTLLPGISMSFFYSFSSNLAWKLNASDRRSCIWYSNRNNNK